MVQNPYFWDTKTEGRTDWHTETETLTFKRHMSLIKWLFLTAQPRSDFTRNASARLYHLGSPSQNRPSVDADVMRPGILRQILPWTLTKSAYFACGATRTVMNSMRHFQHAPAAVFTSSSTIPEKSHDKKLHCCKLRYVQQATCCKSCYHFTQWNICSYTVNTTFHPPGMTPASGL
jgi:hypothetical protein